MAFAITNTVIRTLVPAVVKQVADAAFTTSKAAGTAQDLGFACSVFEVVIYLKTYVVGTSAITGGGPVASPLFWLEGADNSGMSTNLTVLSEQIEAPNIASATSPLVLTLRGRTATTGKQFVRVVVDPTLQSGTVAGTYDALIAAAP